MNKKTKRFLMLTAATIGSMYAYNRFVATTSVSKKMLSDENGTYYNWKYGNIFYSKRGTGSPLLLIHDLNPSSSSFEWCKIMKKLEQNHTVYSLDLLGCGRSDKPLLTYTNYMYVQLITDFVKDVIKAQPDVITTNLSSSFVLMTNQMESNIFHRIILLNPVSIDEIAPSVDTLSKLKKLVFDTPLLGAFVYNRMHTPVKTDFLFRYKYFFKSQLISTKFEDIYYESAHMDNSNGKYLFGSIIGKYINIDIRHALNQLNTPIYIIASRDLTNNINNIESYIRTNTNIETTYLSGCKLLLQLEIPDKLLIIIKSVLSDN